MNFMQLEDKNRQRNSQEFDYDLYVEHIRNYLKGLEGAPVFEISSELFDGVITCSPLHTFAERILDYPEKFKAPIDTAVKYGFRGFSKGGRNGVFYVQKSDSGLIRFLNGKLYTNEEETIQKTGVTGIEGLKALKPVKLVWHKPSGDRVVGYYAEKNKKMVFAGLASY